MLKVSGYEPNLFENPTETGDNSLYILPGVGSFDEGAKRLKDSGWDSLLKKVALNPSNRVLGICLGMQLLCEGSEEGSLNGLHLIPGYFRHFNSVILEKGSEKIPHMGWNTVEFLNHEMNIFKDVNETSKFYFVHSYIYTHINNNYIQGLSHHGVNFASIIRNNNIMGLQFHPEKSHKFGKSLLKKVVAKF